MNDLIPRKAARRPAEEAEPPEPRPGAGAADAGAQGEGVEESADVNGTLRQVVHRLRGLDR
jgi:hypothetical protein